MQQAVSGRVSCGRAYGAGHPVTWPESELGGGRKPPLIVANWEHVVSYSSYI